MFWLLGGAEKSIQPGLEVLVKPAKLEGRHQPHCGSAPRGRGAGVAGSRGPARVSVGSTAERWPGRREEHIAGRAGATEEEEQRAGKCCALGRWCEHSGTRQWQGKLAVIRLATTWIDLGSVCSLSGN